MYSIKIPYYVTFSVVVYAKEIEMVNQSLNNTSQFTCQETLMDFED